MSSRADGIPDLNPHPAHRCTRRHDRLRPSPSRRAGHSRCSGCARSETYREALLNPAPNSELLRDRSAPHADIAQNRARPRKSAKEISRLIAAFGIAGSCHNLLFPGELILADLELT